MNSQTKNEITEEKDNINNNIKEVTDFIKEDELYYVIDYKNKLEIKKNENIINNLDIMDKTIISKLNISNEIDSLNESSFSSNKNNERNTFLDSNIEKFVSIFMDKLFPKNNLKEFNICKKLSLEYFKANGGKIDKDKIEKCINFIYSIKQQNITYSKKITMNLDFINNFGYILMSTYFMFDNYKIADKNELKSNIKKTRKENKDVLLDFFKYCNEKNHDVNTKRKTQFWEKNSKNYYIPGIFIFLINVFDTIENIEIDFEKNGKDYTNEEFGFFAITIFNIGYIFSKINYVKINLNNKIFQKEIYSQSLQEYIIKLEKAGNNLKKRNLNLDSLYNIKWDFKTNFILNEFKKPSDKDIDQTKIDRVNKTFSEFNNPFNLENTNKNKKSINSYNEIEYENNSYDSEDEEYENIHNMTIPYFPYQEAKKDKDIKNSNIFIKIIFLLLNGLNKIKNLNKIDLVLSDSYKEEINYLMKTEIFETANNVNDNDLLLSQLKDFHLLDLIFIIKLKVFNCEFNSLDNSTFKFIIKSLAINNSITTLNISFFSSDISYLQHSLYKLYKNSFPDVELNMHGDVEKNILDKFLPSFTRNLRNFFDILRLKNLQNLGINMDIPDIIENNSKYMLLISKFILNILLYIYRRDSNINSLEKVIILCPKLNLNNEYFPFINTVLSNINKSNTKNLSELSFQAQLYKVINIKNIISASLVILNIGNCDIVTFESLVYYLSSYKFCKESNLKKVSLRLVKSILNLNMEIYSLLFQIFNIKITNLLELNIYTNIIINKDIEYFYLLNIFNNNWISKSIFTLNKSSDNIINMEECLNKKNKIKFFVPYSAENELLSPGEKIKMKNIRKNNEIKNDEIFWILKYIFKIRYSCNDNINRNESVAKFLTNNILSYNHFIKNMDIQHYFTETDLINDTPYLIKIKN